jgi:very-short-patch-repair endonuclease
MTLCIDRKGSRSFCGKEECKYHFDKSFASFQGMCCGSSDTKHCEENGCNCGKKKVDCWDKEKNGDIMPLQITTNSGKKIWLKCNVCNHSFDIHPNNVQNGKWCPYCSMPPRKMCYQEECKRCTEKSFVSCDFHINWSIENRDQPEGYDGLYLQPRWVFKNSNDKYKFKCPTCYHTYSSIIGNVIKGQRCDYCSIGTSSLCNEDTCLHCNKKSFASHEMAKYWSNKNKVNPRQITKGSDDKYLFDCPDCHHTFEASVGRISRGSWCPYCCYPPQKLCVEEVDCGLCLNKSFASSPYKEQYSSKNIISSRMTFLHSNQERYFDCIYCKKINKMKVSDFTAGNRCGYCKNKSEKKLYDFIIKHYPTIQHQFKPDWCINHETKRHWPFDFVIEEYKLIIELDGVQHFIQVSNWTSPDENQKRDKIKEELAKSKGYSLIRILQEDVWYDKNNWQQNLLEKIKTMFN